jgi:hypothetical protein
MSIKISLIIVLCIAKLDLLLYFPLCDTVNGLLCHKYIAAGHETCNRGWRLCICDGDGGRSLMPTAILEPDGCGRHGDGVRCKRALVLDVGDVKLCKGGSVIDFLLGQVQKIRSEKSQTKFKLKKALCAFI